MPWMPARPIRDTDAPPSPALLTVDPLDPLPHRVTPPVATRPPRFPAEARVLLGLVLLAGNPWVAGQAVEWRYDLSDGEGLAGLFGVAAETVLVGLTWPAWNLWDVPDGAAWWFVVENTRTVLFVVLTVVLLRRLAASPAPPGLHRVLGQVGAAVLGAALAAVAALLLHVVLGTDLSYRGSGGYLRGAVSAAVTCGFVVGLLVAWLGPAVARRAIPSDDRTGGA
ncbi:hypothetical protein [Micromonospora sp. H33]|uniref:hypothetical protein n=1 Tax=Micromonospora sp. H33 TaxID=3452215 RepID=UPI003F8C670A